MDIDTQTFFSLSGGTDLNMRKKVFFRNPTRMVRHDFPMFFGMLKGFTRRFENRSYFRRVAIS